MGDVTRASGSTIKDSAMASSTGQMAAPTRVYSPMDSDMVME